MKVLAVIFNLKNGVEAAVGPFDGYEEAYQKADDLGMDFAQFIEIESPDNYQSSQVLSK
jgi:hypothetical protein